MERYERGKASLEVPVATDLLCMRTQQIDEALREIEFGIDWLGALLPTANQERWEAFVASDFTKAPALSYRPLTIDIKEHRDRLDSLPMDEVQHAGIEALLRQKARELEEQLDLISQRGKSGFVTASIACFGAPKPGLLATAKQILAHNVREQPSEDFVSVEELVQSVVDARARYRQNAPDFSFDVFVIDDLNSMLMVNHGDLYVDRNIKLPRSRLDALLAHEVGTHIVTRYNGRHQPLLQLESGLAHYDSLQEGLATLAEFLVGSLPMQRLRILAARVVAVQHAIEGDPLETIFALLHNEYGVPAPHAFSTAVRAKSGGGLTKDACYLKGLEELLGYLAEDADIEFLYAGKFSLANLPTLKSLRSEGLVRDPVLLPEHITSAKGHKRLSLARRTSLKNLHAGAENL